MKLFNVILIVYSLLIGSVFGATITDDTVKIGKPGSSANKEITLGTSKKIRANESTGKLEFSNDGVLYKNLGSGSGTGGSTGISILENASFEDGLTPGWTSSGGTFTQETYAVGFEGNTKYARFVASGAGQYVEQIVSVPTSFSGGCQADFKKVNVSTAGLFKVQALDASDNVLAEQTIGVSSWEKVPTFGFPCPTSGTNNLKLRMISISAGTIDFDLGYIGSNQNLVSVAQAKFFGGIKYSKTAGCTWSTTSATYATFAAQAACPTPTVTGSASAPGTKIPGITFATMPAGQYFFILKARLGQNTAGSAATGQYRFYDGVTDYDEQAGGASQLGGATTTTFTLNSLSQNISYASTQTNVTVQLKGLTTNAANATIVDSATFSDFSIDVYYFPSSSEVAVSNEQASWFIDANIGGGNASLGTVNVTSYTEIASSVLDLVLNPGSAQAKIACSGTNPSTGLTCSTGNESIGITFTPPYAGKFEVCTQFTWEGVSSSGGNLNVAFQNVLTANSSQTIIEEGKERASAQVNGLQYNQSKPFRVCGHFTFNDTSEKTVRLMYEQAQGPSTSSLIMADRSATVGQRDIHITVKPVLSAYNRPILLENPIIKASYYLGSNGSYGNSQAINFDIKEYDSHNAVTIGSAWKFTTPANGAGVYSVLVYGTATASVVWKIYKNGSQYKTLCQNVVSSSACMGSTNILLNDGDYIDIRPDTASVTVTGGTLSSNTATIAITRVGK